MNVLALVPYLYDTAPGQRFRIEQWVRFLEPRGVRCRFIPFESTQLKEVLHTNRHYVTKIKELLRGVWKRVKLLQTLDEPWDVIVLHRELLPIGPALLEQILSKRRIPLVYDFDDAIFLPDVSEANRYFGWLKWPQKTATICQVSNRVIVGNQHLKSYAMRYTPHVVVIPTTIDTTRYSLKVNVQPQPLPVIGWSGSLTTLKHLKGLVSVLKALRRQVAFRLKVIGASHFTLDGFEVESHPWKSEDEVTQLQSFDIGIMPLPDDDWSKGKCALKALQYMAVGVPTVASPVGVNAEIIQDGYNGSLASNEQEWIEKLLRLIRDLPLREQFAREGRKTVEQKYSTHIQAPRFLEVLQQACQTSSSSSLCAEVLTKA